MWSIFKASLYRSNCLCFDGTTFFGGFRMMLLILPRQMLCESRLLSFSPSAASLRHLHNHPTPPTLPHLNITVLCVYVYTLKLITISSNEISYRWTASPFVETEMLHCQRSTSFRISATDHGKRRELQCEAHSEHRFPAPSSKRH